eukprot:Gregarina_sp_Poly_1__6924@NODE_375_length_9112_cov_54_178331_g309_i0_p5_GENE_NODE_375_length_9112_cov_54_178331_g309_i0NODE_375_length_9112_cov_54_178331_g309_i0_p5_ORF_typecomplete_len104_score4_84_NODE_375_length_9112_cov_54_178331_g309_i0248559
MPGLTNLARQYPLPPTNQPGGSATTCGVQCTRSRAQALSQSVPQPLLSRQIVKRLILPAEKRTPPAGGTIRSASLSPAVASFNPYRLMRGQRQHTWSVFVQPQ